MFLKNVLILVETYCEVCGTEQHHARNRPSCVAVSLGIVICMVKCPQSVQVHLVTRYFPKHSTYRCEYGCGGIVNTICYVQIIQLSRHPLLVHRCYPCALNYVSLIGEIKPKNLIESSYKHLKINGFTICSIRKFENIFFTEVLSCALYLSDSNSLI